jgi:IS30 family transposase
MSQITSEQRYTISVLLKQGVKPKDIAKIIDKDRSSIYREINRNKDQRNGNYKAKLAERKCRKRHKTKPKFNRFTPEIKLKVKELIKEDYSPEQVHGFCKKEEIPCVSHETIYQHIWKDKKQKGSLYTHLRRQGRKYRKRGAAKDNRGIIKNRVGIEKRPDIVEKRERFGDFEVDLIIGANHKSAIVTLNDRASGVLKMKKVSSKEAKVVTKAINSLMEEWTPYLHTITADNGKEFAGHLEVAEFLNIDYYFARPYHSWERGSNENLNGLIRQYIKKKSDFRTLSDEYVKSIETKLNNRPRKRLNYQTPIFAMEKLLYNESVAFMS